MKFCLPPWTNGPPTVATEVAAITTIPDAISSCSRLCCSVVGVSPSTPIRPVCSSSVRRSLSETCPRAASICSSAPNKRQPSVFVRPQSVHLLVSTQTLAAPASSSGIYIGIHSSA
ncbi:hypothetical protein ACLOJK_000200 [Asimina triloba]